MKTVAVLIPCYNEAYTIVSVVSSFKKYLPNAIIYVYDNGSDDNTANFAKEAGATVVAAKIRGKGSVVRKMFSDIDADIYIIVDGDSTYMADDANRMINSLIEEKADMVVAVRKEKPGAVYKDWHKFGNKIFNFILKILFNSTFRDVFSGYRVFSKRFVKTFPAMTNGFDIEAELSIHALTLNIPFVEVDSMYLERPANSYSKLKTFKDGVKILISIVKLLKEIRPLFFFSIISSVLFLLSVIISYPIIVTFIKTGLVYSFPSVILSICLVVMSFLSLTCGVILDGLSKACVEMKRLHYLHFN